MKRNFHEQNELTYYCETAEELASYEGRLPAGAVVEYNGKKEDGTSDFHVYMVYSDGTLIEL